MGFDSTAGMQSPVMPGQSVPQLQNLARGMDPQQGAYGAGGPAMMKGQQNAPAQPNQIPQPGMTTQPIMDSTAPQAMDQNHSRLRTAIAKMLQQRRMG